MRYSLGIPPFFEKRMTGIEIRFEHNCHYFVEHKNSYLIIK